MKIPTVEFTPQQETNAGVELLQLKSVYKRSSKLKVNMFAPHRVQFHHLIYITQGSGTHFIDFHEYPFKKGNIIFINQHQVHAFDSKKQHDGIMILFTQEFIDSIQTSIRVPVFSTGFYSPSVQPVLKVKNELQKSCETLLSEMKNLDGQKQYDPLIMQLLFTSLILKLHRERSDHNHPSPSESRRQQFANFLSLVEKHFVSVRDATDYAKKMSITYKTLNQLCKQATRQTPKQLIDAHTILEAKRRLAIENVQVSELAYDLGFEEVSNFVKYFKKHTSLTPSKFKETISG